MSLLNQVKNGSQELNYGSTPEQIQAYIDIVTSFLSDILSRRGTTIEEWRAFRKQTVQEEVAFIDEELSKLEGNPLPEGPVPPLAE